MAKRADIKGFFITGTDTGVGKTIVTACLLSLFRKYNLSAGVMKPIETGVTGRTLSDAEFLIETEGAGSAIADVAPVRFKTPASPLQASKIEKRPINIKSIWRKFHELAYRHEYMLVEGVGGILAPITEKYLVIDLIREMRLPLIVVCRHTLGTLNHTLLTLRAAQAEGIEVRGIIFNQTAPKMSAIEKQQPAIVRELTKIPILGECHYIKNVSPASFTPKLLAEIEKKLDFDGLRAE
jgi:dethiobiotin synthetase